MKTKLIAIVSSMALAITSLIGCTNSDSNAGLENQQPSAMSGKTCKTVDFTAADFGELHNQYVISLYNGVDFSNPTVARSKILNNFQNMGIDTSVFNMSEDEFKSKVLSVNEQLSTYKYDLRQWSNNPISQKESYPYIVRILNETDNINNLDAFNDKLSLIEQEAQANLSCDDLDVVLGTVKVAKSSAKLWAPTTLGGDGFFDSTFGQDPPMQIMSWRGALIGDVSGSAQYFTAIGVAGAAGLGVPGANAVILGGWGIAAALASGCGALGF